MNASATKKPVAARTASRLTAAALLAVTGLAASPALAIDAASAVTLVGQLHARGLTGNGRLIGQIEDDRARLNHTAYAGRLFHGDATGNNNAQHPTHVAGIMIASPVRIAGVNYSGVAPRASVKGVGWPGTDAGFGTSLDSLMNAGLRPRMVNISAGLDLPRFTVNEYNNVQAMGDYMAHSLTTLVVAAAGNEGANGAGTIRAPGSGFNVLTVGATGRNRTQDYTTLAPFSSHGMTRDLRNKPDIVAPGVLIFSPDAADVDANGSFDDWRDNYGGNNVNGTSFAAPQVSGAAALLHQHGANRAMNLDPRVMRANFINAANKSVKDLAGNRWDQTTTINDPINPLNNQTGSGQLDAERTLLQYDSKEHAPTIGNGASGNDVPVTGWDFGTVADAGTNYYRTKDLRKGSYLTATAAWERHTSRTGANFFYTSQLDDLDMYVSQLGNILTPLKESRSPTDSVEHLVYKTGARDQYYVNVRMAANHSGGSEDYGLAWWGYEAPKQVKEFNGSFTGDRGALLDNGWYPGAGTLFNPEIVKPVFGDLLTDEGYALELLNDSSMSQELVRPVGWFELGFDFGFLFDDATAGIQVFLGDINLMEYDSWEGDMLTADEHSTMNYNYYFNRFEDAEIFAALSGGFSELTFKLVGTGVNIGYIDNVTYLPTPGATACLVAGLALIINRRRRTA